MDDNIIIQTPIHTILRKQEYFLVLDYLHIMYNCRPNLYIVDTKQCIINVRLKRKTLKKKTFISSSRVQIIANGMCNKHAINQMFHNVYKHILRKLVFNI